MTRLGITAAMILAAAAWPAFAQESPDTEASCDSRGILGKLECAFDEMERESGALEAASLDRTQEYRALEDEQLLRQATAGGIGAEQTAAMAAVLATHADIREVILAARRDDLIDRNQMVDQARSAREARDDALREVLGEAAFADLDFGDAGLRAGAAFMARPTDRPFLAASHLKSLCLSEGRPEWAMCQGYVMAVADGEMGGPEICVPRSLQSGRAHPVEQLVAPVRERLRDLTFDDGKRPAQAVVAEALAAAFPCKEER